ncbi:MAG: ROK family transcriptional regulator [Pseudomonadota bacterium]
MSFGHQRNDSRLILLREIAAAGRVARIDLAQRTGISRATVTTITADLLRDGLIAEVPVSLQAVRGRPRVDLKLNGASHLVAGVKVSNSWLSVVLMDFAGTERAGRRLDVPPGRHTPDALAALISDGVAEVLAGEGLEPSALSAVGIGLSGIIDAGTGHVHWSPSLTLRNVDMWEPLEQVFGVPVHIDNDANLVAVAERRFGLARGRDNFIVVTVEAGVGMGLMLGGEIYRGARGAGAEFGHTKVHLEGALCRCGQRGCLEAYVADYALEREGRTLLGDGPDVLQRLLGAAQSDPAAATIVDRAGRMFALGLANLVNLFDPEVIILAGEALRFEHLYADAVMAEIAKSTVQMGGAAPEVLIHPQDRGLWARGAAAFALDHVMEDAAQGNTRAG